MPKRRFRWDIMAIIALIVIVVAALVVSLTIDFSGGDGCDYDQEGKTYIGKSQDECSRIKFLCASGSEYFSDSCGCGCIETDGEERTYCTPQSREGDVCITLYQPVCGWNDPEKVQCIRYPCAETYSNSCVACHNDNVLYYTEGECPA